jgi:hypothetical protein
MKRASMLSVVPFLVLMAQGFAQPVDLTCKGPAPNNNLESKLTFDEAVGRASWANQDSSTATFTDRAINMVEQSRRR